ARRHAPARAALQAHAGELVADGEAAVLEAWPQHHGVAPGTEAATEPAWAARVRHHLVARHQQRVLLLQRLDRQVACVGHVRPADVETVLAETGAEPARAGLVVDERAPAARVDAADDHQL